MTRKHTKKAQPQPKDVADYEPTPGNIRAATREFQRKWTPAQEWKALHGEIPFRDSPYTIPRVRR